LLKHVFHSINEEQEKTYLQGPAFYGLSITYLIFFSIITGNNVIPLASALVLIISDPLAALVGKRYGKNVFLILGNNRTVEGSLAMLLSNSIIISLFFGFGVKAIAISFIITIIELISPSKIDDFTLPLSASLLLINY
jgi:phytol kinase